MGLDMMLSKRTYVKNWDYQKDEQKHNVTVKLNGKSRKDIKPKRINRAIAMKNITPIDSQLQFCFPQFGQRLTISDE